ncbi:MAG TPA: response regulator [Caulobacteraceae bacterium]
MAERPLEGLRGKLILVVEDDFIIATDLALALEDCGAEVLGPAASVDDALELIAAGHRLSGALLDINLGQELAYPIADELRRRGVPFIFATGYDAWIIPDPYRNMPRCEKPVDTRIVERLLNEGNANA